MRTVRQYVKNLFNTHEPSEKVRQEAYEQITLSLNKAFALPSLTQYSQTLSLRGLLIKAVQMFVGSRAMPKNINLARYLLQLAEKKAVSERQKDEIEYYKYFFLRIDAFKNGQEAEFNLSTDMLSKLAEEKQHPQACYLVGKQLMNVSEGSQTEERKKMAKLAAQYFMNSLTENQYGGLFYLAHIMKNQEYTTMQEHEVREFYVYGAAMGDPMCYFQMAQIHQQEDNRRLYVKYLKMAAEAGVMEAQHNLGCQYLNGKNLPKDEVKALTWFLHAAVYGFVQAKYNVVYLFLKGSECGRIKVNKKVALLKLHELLKAGEPVEEKIRELVESEDKEKQSGEGSEPDKAK